MHRPPAARVALPLVAAALALTASVALGADETWAPAGTRPAASVEELAKVEGVTAGVPTTAGVLSTAGDRSGDAASAGAAPASALGLAAQTLGWAGPSSTSAPLAATTSSTTSIATPTRAVTTTAPVWWSRYHGTNHVWMPTLGISKAVSFYACSRSTYPANYVYRWGCGGRNNIYLFGHNFGVFSPLYVAWRNGTLRKGLPVVYADGSGRTRLYRVVAWRVVKPTDTAWATASQSLPSLTLQTCADRAGTYRLVVRLVSVAR